MKDWILRYAEQSSDEEEEEKQEEEGKGGGNKMANGIESEGKFDPVSPVLESSVMDNVANCEDTLYFSVCVCVVTPFHHFVLVQNDRYLGLTAQLYDTREMAATAKSKKDKAGQRMAQDRIRIIQQGPPTSTFLSLVKDRTGQFLRYLF